MTMSIERTQIGGKKGDMTYDRIEELKSIQVPNAIFSPRELSRGNQNYERLDYTSYRGSLYQSVELQIKDSPAGGIPTIPTRVQTPEEVLYDQEEEKYGNLPQIVKPYVQGLQAFHSIDVNSSA